MTRRYLTLRLLMVSTPLLLYGCAQPRAFDDLWVAPRSYQMQVHTYQPPRDIMQRGRHTTMTQAVPNPTGEITLHEAVGLALAQNPELKAKGWAVVAAEAEAAQLGQAKNPRVSLGIDNFAAPDGLDALPRQTLRISQVIELAGKREKRLKLGQATQRLKAWDYEQQRIETAAKTAMRYVTVVVAQQRVALARQQLALAQAAYAIADDRARNGIRPGYERDQAGTQLALSKIELEQTSERLALARADLAASWGADQPAFISAQGDLRAKADLLTLDELQDRLPASPHLARWEDEIAQREGTIALQRANAVTDPSISGGVRYLSELDETVGLAEVSWPLPLLDRNEHGILAARLRLSQTLAQRDAAQAEINRQLSRAYTRAQSASNSLRTLQEQAIPKAQAAYDATYSAYEAGQVDYLAALQTKRSLLDLKRMELETLLAYHSALIDLEHTIAGPIHRPAHD